MLELNRLYNMDCMEGMKQIKTRSIDMILCDLPYGKTKSKWDRIINPESMWCEFLRVAKPNAAILLFAVPPFDKFLYSTNPKMYRYDWIWEKNKTTGHLNKDSVPMLDYELIMVFYSKAPTYSPQMRKGMLPMNAATTMHTSGLYGSGKATKNNAGTTDRYPKRILKFDVVNNDDPERIHPNQKPVPLCGYMLKTYTNEGETVLDATTGSASIPIACADLKRNYIGFETDAAIFGKACKRIEAVQAQMSLF